MDRGCDDGSRPLREGTVTRQPGTIVVRWGRGQWSVDWSRNGVIWTGGGAGRWGMDAGKDDGRSVEEGTAQLLRRKGC